MATTLYQVQQSDGAVWIPMPAMGRKLTRQAAEDFLKRMKKEIPNGIFRIVEED